MCSDAATGVWLEALGAKVHLEPLLVWQKRVIQLMPSEWQMEMLRWHRYAIAHTFLTTPPLTTVQCLVPPVTCGRSAFYARLTGLTQALEWWYTVTNAPHSRSAVVANGLLYGLQRTTASSADFVVLRPRTTLHETAMMPCPVLRMADVVCGNVWQRTGGDSTVVYFKSTNDDNLLLQHDIHSGMTTYSHKKNEDSLSAVFLCHITAPQPPPSTGV